MFINMICQEMKAEYQRSGCLLQSLSVPEQKLEELAMDFVAWLPRVTKMLDCIWVIVKQLAKSAHLILIENLEMIGNTTQKYVEEIVCNGMHKVIISDWGPTFTTRFWKASHEAFGIKLNKVQYNISPMVRGPEKKNDSDSRSPIVAKCQRSVQKLGSISTFD